MDSSLAEKVRDAWLDYDLGRTPEGRFMKEMDKLECMVQAHEYEQSTYGTKDLAEFQEHSSKVTSPVGRDWLKFLQEERKEHFSGREHRLPIMLVSGMWLPRIFTTTSSLATSSTDVPRLINKYR